MILNYSKSYLVANVAKALQQPEFSNIRHFGVFMSRQQSLGDCC